MQRKADAKYYWMMLIDSSLCLSSLLVTERWREISSGQPLMRQWLWSRQPIYHIHTHIYILLLWNKQSYSTLLLHKFLPKNFNTKAIQRLFLLALQSSFRMRVCGPGMRPLSFGFLTGGPHHPAHSKDSTARGANDGFVSFPPREEEKKSVIQSVRCCSWCFYYDHHTIIIALMQALIMHASGRYCSSFLYTWYQLISRQIQNQ